MINIDGTINETSNDYGTPIFRLGFRPFFLVAGLFAIISMIIWMASYVFSVEFAFSGLAPGVWHAHEMLFGYVMAVVAGFLLTAIKNWTGVEVLRGKGLAALLSLWLVARILPLFGLMFSIELIAIVDVLFMLVLALVCLRPVVKVKQYNQIIIITLLFVLMLCNVFFYLGVIGVIEMGVQWGLYSAMYMVIALVLLMMRRVMPMFIENGVDGDVEMTNHPWVDVASLVFLFCLWAFDVFINHEQLSSLMAAILTLLHVIRLSGWYTNKIWSKPLVWVLVLAYAFFIMGFALKALALVVDISPFLSTHAFTVGGIGLVTIGMMSRVSLGHTGRNVFEPPKIVFWSLLILLLGAIVRVVFPLFSMDLYIYWVAISQVFWIVAFAVFTMVYAPMLLAPRADGRDG